MESPFSPAGEPTGVAAGWRAGRGVGMGPSRITLRSWSTETESPWELHQPPGGTDGGVGDRVAAGWECGDHVVGLGVGDGLVASRGDLGDEFGELVRVFEVHREEALVTGSPAQRLGFPVETRDPDRHTGPLHGPRQEPHAVDGVVLAPIVDGLA